MPESPKAETRLGPLYREALKSYMRDRHLKNDSEVLRSALGQFLEKEGYLIKCAEEPDGYRLNVPPQEPPEPTAKGRK